MATAMATATAKNPRKTSALIFTYVTLPSLLEYAVNRDDPEYWDQPQWMRDLFWMFKIRGHWVRIPKPFELGLIFGTLPVRILEWIDREDPEAVSKFFKETLLAELEPIAPMPNAALPLIENLYNYSFFLDRPIVPRGEQEREPRYQFGPRTSEVAKLIGRWGGVSPRKIDNLLYSWTGGLGRLGTDVVDYAAEKAGLRPPAPARRIEDVPGIRGVMARPPGFQSESIDRFYRRLTEARRVRSTLRGLERMRNFEDLERERADPENLRLLRVLPDLEKASDELRSLRLRADALMRDEEMDPEEKRLRMDELGERARQRAARVLEMLNR